MIAPWLNTLRQRIPTWLGGRAPAPPLKSRPIGRDMPSSWVEGITTRAGRRRVIEAAYDAAGWGSATANSWQNADHLSADEANSPAVREIARSRSRYECLEANSFLKGAIHTVSQDLVGRGPRLQLQLTDEAANKEVEKLWRKWSKATKLAKQLRTLVISRIVDGEGFGLFTTSSTIGPKLPSLLFRTFEADRCLSPWGTAIDGDLQVDGLRIDDQGEPLGYFVYDEVSPLKLGTPREIDRREVCHLFRCDRAGQHRGIPELLTSLTLCVLLRDYTLASVTSARTAAKHAVMLESQATAVNYGETPTQPIEAFSQEEVDYDMITALPTGWKASQLKAEQPTTTYEMFRDALLAEIVRPLGAPLNIVLGSSAKWNYASSQADHISYALKQLIEREELETEVVDRAFEHWWREAQLMGLLPEPYAALEADEIPHAWFWDSRRDADPQTMASARDINLKNGSTNRSDELFAMGKDYQSHDEEGAKSLGLTVEQYRQLVAKQIFGEGPVDSVLQASSTGSSSVPMNGAQLQSLSLIVSQVSQGLIDPLAARAMVAVAFPGLRPEQIDPMFPSKPAAVAPTPRPASLAAHSSDHGWLTLEAYSEDQPRADNGQFGEGAGSSSAKSSPQKTVSSNLDDVPESDRLRVGQTLKSETTPMGDVELVVTDTASRTQTGVDPEGVEYEHTNTGYTVELRRGGEVVETSTGVTSLADVGDSDAGAAYKSTVKHARSKGELVAQGQSGEARWTVEKDGTGLYAARASYGGQEFYSESGLSKAAATRYAHKEATAAVKENQ